MNKTIYLENYRDLKITKQDLYNILSDDLDEKHINSFVKINAYHIICLLEQYKSGLINDEKLLEWVNVIWFSNYFDYCDEESEVIASVMNHLEEIDEEGNELNSESLEKYLFALHNNISVD